MSRTWKFLQPSGDIDYCSVNPTPPVPHNPPGCARKALTSQTIHSGIGSFRPEFPLNRHSIGEKLMLIQSVTLC